MENNAVLVDCLRLDNGLDLNIYDASRRVAADRWRVELIARIHVAVTDERLSGLPASCSSAAEIKAVLGSQVSYEKVLVRNFIDHKEKEHVFKGLYDSFLASVRQYLSHPEFPRRFLLQQYLKARDRRKWRLPGASEH